MPYHCLTDSCNYLSCLHIIFMIIQKIVEYMRITKHTHVIENSTFKTSAIFIWPDCIHDAAEGSLTMNSIYSLRWRHNGLDIVSNHQPHNCLLNRLFRRRSKKTSNLRVTGLCAGSSPGTGEFPAQMANYAENVSVSWRHHVSELKLSITQSHNLFSVVKSCN